MKRFFAQWHALTLGWHYFVLELMLVTGLVLFAVVPSASAMMRLQERSLYMNSTSAGETTFYRLSFRYMSPDPVGSVELLFCKDPIPYHPCDTPEGFSSAAATLGEQLGETGFSIAERTGNRLLLSRPSTAPTADTRSSYELQNLTNPNRTDEAFSVRIKTFSASDGSEPQVDFGSVRGQITEAIVIETQVPPMLIFCLAQEVQYNCNGTNEVYYSDMGELDPEHTLTAQSQMAVGTNASGGFAIVATGAPLSAGTNVIPAMTRPAQSQPGVNQFGINLVANNAPVVGLDPEGEWANATAIPEYGQPDRYKFVPGDVVAFSPNVSLMKKFTVSYIANSSADLRPGVYTTTVNFIATGRF